MMQLATLPNGKRVLFIEGNRPFPKRAHIFQQWPGYEWEPFDPRILMHTPIPRESIVEQWNAART
jgi:hypothetical protein